MVRVCPSKLAELTKIKAHARQSLEYGLYKHVCCGRSTSDTDFICYATIAPFVLVSDPIRRHGMLSLQTPRRCGDIITVLECCATIHYIKTLTSVRGSQKFPSRAHNVATSCYCSPNRSQR